MAITKCCRDRCTASRARSRRSARSRSPVGILQSLILVLRLRPEALLLTGGWVGFPVAVACWLLRRPIVIYVPDIEPGLALQLMGRYFARVIAATVAETSAVFPRQARGRNRLPAARRKSAAPTASARSRRFKLDPGAPDAAGFRRQQGIAQHQYHAGPHRARSAGGWAADPAHFRAAGLGAGAGPARGADRRRSGRATRSLTSCRTSGRRSRRRIW